MSKRCCAKSHSEWHLWEEPNSVSNVLTKVTSLWLNPQLLIALHSPYALLETDCTKISARLRDRLATPPEQR